MLADDQIIVAGHPFVAIGMGEQMRACVRSLKTAGSEVRIRDIYGVPTIDPDYRVEFGAMLSPQLSTRANIFNINGDEIEPCLAHLNDTRFAKAFNVICPAWELPAYPVEWARQVERFSEVWAISTFVRDSIASSTSLPVIHMPQAVEPVISEMHSRRSLGLPDHAFIFLFFFDFTSYLERKNPFAVLDAFNRLVERNPNAPLHLVLKHKGKDSGGSDEARFREAISRHSDQIQIIDRSLSNSEVRSLVRNANCFVSLHRSEGFGFGLAESMALGTPVIGTAYSGNMDFMTPDNSWLVDFDMIPVRPGQYPHAEGQHWADPRIGDAAELMEAVWNNRDLAMRKAERARRDMAHKFSARATGLRYLERLETALNREVAGARQVVAGA